MASIVPLWEDWPKLASLPCRDAYSPTLMVSASPAWPPLLLQPVAPNRSASAATADKSCSRQFFIKSFFVDPVQHPDSQTFWKSPNRKETAIEFQPSIVARASRPVFLFFFA